MAESTRNWSIYFVGLARRQKRLERTVRAELENDAQLVSAFVPHAAVQSHQVQVPQGAHDDDLRLELAQHCLGDLAHAHGLHGDGNQGGPAAD